MINFGTIVFALAAVMALCGLGYYLIIMYFVMPRVLKKYGEDASRSKLWKAKVEKVRHYKLIMIYTIGLAFCLLVLIWNVIEVHFLKVVP